MRILSAAVLRKMQFYGVTSLSLFTLISFQNCGRVKFSVQDASIISQSCGDIQMSPPNGLTPDDSVSFEVILPGALTLSSLNWSFTKDNSQLFTSQANPVVHTFNGSGEGIGSYEATASFTKSDGDSCILNRVFQITGDLCVNPSGISGPSTGFVGEPTSNFSMDFESCFNGSVSWDMNNDNIFEYSFPTATVGTPVNYTYPAAGTYTVEAIVNNSDTDSEGTFTHQIVISNKSCINPFNNQVVAHGQTVEFAKPNPTCNSACLRTNKTCNNGVFVGDSTYTQNPATCAVSGSCSCTNGATNPPTCNQFNGACGSVHTTTVSSLTNSSANICVANNVSPASPFAYNSTSHRYEWSCTGLGGGTTVSNCYANKTYTGTWTANPAPLCTTSCGYAGGTLTGTVTCSNNDCDPATRPQAQTRTCAPTTRCYTGVWAVSAPPPCPTTCGYAGGTQIGTVICSNNDCDPATKPAVPVSTCPATSPCYGVWTANPAPLCPTACGLSASVQTGTVTCSTSLCNPATRPQAQTRSCLATPSCVTQVRRCRVPSMGEYFFVTGAVGENEEQTLYMEKIVAMSPATKYPCVAKLTCPTARLDAMDAAAAAAAASYNPANDPFGIGPTPTVTKYSPNSSQTISEYGIGNGPDGAGGVYDSGYGGRLVDVPGQTSCLTPPTGDPMFTFRFSEAGVRSVDPSPTGRIVGVFAYPRDTISAGTTTPSCSLTELPYGAPSARTSIGSADKCWQAALQVPWLADTSTAFGAPGSVFGWVGPPPKTLSNSSTVTPNIGPAQTNAGYGNLFSAVRGRDSCLLNVSWDYGFYGSPQSWRYKNQAYVEFKVECSTGTPKVIGDSLKWRPFTDF